MGEEFTESNVKKSIESFLEYGEDEFGNSHGGYFSGDGWAARVLKWHLNQLKFENSKGNHENINVRTGDR